MSLDIKKRIITSVFLVIFLFSMFIDRNFLFIALIVISTVSIFEFYKLITKILKKNVFKKYASVIFFIIYIILFNIVFYSLALGYETRLFVLVTVLICIASDIGGLVFGKMFKGKKLTKISPNKTISGSIGSFTMSFLVIFLLISVNLLSAHKFIFIYCFFTTLFCQLGDLFFSYLKRKAKVKDTGNLLPGHGGILDRIDGIIVGTPVGILVFYLLAV
jgi:phosphatidate cytidylyltransferase